MSLPHCVAGGFQENIFQGGAFNAEVRRGDVTGDERGGHVRQDRAVALDGHPLAGSLDADQAGGTDRRPAGSSTLAKALQISSRARNSRHPTVSPRMMALE